MIASTPIRYARNGARYVAYQTFGDGTPDVVLVPAILSHLEANLALAGYRRFVETIAAAGRCIVFDKSGQGMSDPASGISSFGERARDVDAILEATGTRRAVLVGNSEGALVAAMFAATRPERVSHLVLFGGFTGPVPAAAVEARAAALVESWGTGRVGMRSLLPSALGDADQERAFAALERNTYSPGRVREAYLMNADLDLSAALATLSVPTLVLHRRGDRSIPLEAGQALARAIPGAIFAVLDDADDHLIWGGDGEAVARRILVFADVAAPGDGRESRMLAAVLFTDIVGSTALALAVGDAAFRGLLDAYDAMAAAEVRREGGRVVKSTGDGTLAWFRAPGQAARAALAIREKAAGLGLNLRAAIHVGEVERRGDDIAGFAVHLAARLLEAAGDGVLATRTVRDLTTGSGIGFAPAGTLAPRGFDTCVEIFRVTDARA